MTEGELHPLYGSESELARCFEFLSEAVARAPLFVTTKMLRSPCNDRVQGTPLGRLQRALRDEARTWPDPLPKLRPGRDYRSAVKKKRDEIERYLKQYQLQERQLTIAAQCFNFGEAVVDRPGLGCPAGHGADQDGSGQGFPEQAEAWLDAFQIQLGQGLVDKMIFLQPGGQR